MVVLKYSEHSFLFFLKFLTILEPATEGGRERQRDWERQSGLIVPVLADVQQWDVWPKLCQACGYQHNGDRLSSPWLLILHYCHFRPISQLRSRLCVCVWNSGVKFTADYSLIHYAEWVLNYVKQRVREKGDLHCKVTIWGGAQEGHSGDEGMFWLVRSCLTLREASRPWNARKHHRGQHVALV